MVGAIVVPSSLARALDRHLLGRFSVLRVPGDRSKRGIISSATIRRLGLLLPSAFGANPFAVVVSAQISVGANVQVSRANAERDHYEVLVAADPDNPSHLLGCSMIEAKQPSTQGWTNNTIVYGSMDGGASWRPTLEVDQGVFGNSDPACTFGIDNHAYFTTLVM